MADIVINDTGISGLLSIGNPSIVIDANIVVENIILSALINQANINTNSSVSIGTDAINISAIINTPSIVAGIGVKAIIGRFYINNPSITIVKDNSIAIDVFLTTFTINDPTFSFDPTMITGELATYTDPLVPDNVVDTVPPGYTTELALPGLPELDTVMITGC